jgi:hypothetical protein
MSTKDVPGKSDKALSNYESNPFQEESQDLLSLDTKDIAHHTTAELISTHLEKGRVHFLQYMEGLAKENESTFYEPIKKQPVDFSDRNQSLQSCQRIGS